MALILYIKVAGVEGMVHIGNEESNWKEGPRWAELIMGSVCATKGNFI